MQCLENELRKRNEVNLDLLIKYALLYDYMYLVFKISCNEYSLIYIYLLTSIPLVYKLYNLIDPNLKE